MYKLLFLSSLLLSTLYAFGTNPNAEEILKKSREKCKSIQNGYFEIINYKKNLTNQDTNITKITAYFEKLEDDTVSQTAFHYQYYQEGEYARSKLYTGEEFVNYTKSDSSGTIMSNALWADKIEAILKSHTSYVAFLNRGAYPLPKESAFEELSTDIVEFIGEETINGIPCYHIKLNSDPESGSPTGIKMLRIEHNYWISQINSLPLQYSLALDLIMNNDTMYQFEKNVLTKHEFNKLRVNSQLALSSIPAFIKLKDYQVRESPDLLKVGSVAPSWSLNSTRDETINLSDFAGRLVLVDFFYKSCYPCMLAIPELQDLHERYQDKGLNVIGINPVDTKEDDIEKFLIKRGVSYPVLLEGKEVSSQYHVSAYPTIYLLDQEGKILFVQVGYGEGVKAMLEEIIISNL